MKKSFIYVLKSENLSNLGGMMGTEYTTTNYIKYFTSFSKAKKFAEKEYGGKIKWVESSNSEDLTSGDLRYVMYNIGVLKIES